MLRSQEPLPCDLMNIISDHLGEGWENVLASLPHVSYARIEQNMIGLHLCIREVIYKILLDWTEAEDDRATIGFITKLLWRNHWDVVYIMKEEYKKSHLDNYFEVLPFHYV